MRVFITGAGGFIGSHLVEDQLRRGNAVTALDIHTEALIPANGNPNLKVVEGDFTDRERVDPLLTGHDVCFHLASAHLETDVAESHFYRVNAQGARNFAERCRQAGVPRFVHCSSAGVYGEIRNPPANELSECNPDLPYEKSKLAGESAILGDVSKSGYNLVIIRPAWVYGPRCPRTERLFRTIRKGRFFFVGDGRTLRHPIYIDDMTEGFQLAATSHISAGAIFIMAGPRAVTLIELAGEIADVLGVRHPALKVPRFLAFPAVSALEAGSKVLKKKASFTRRSLKFYSGNHAFDITKARNTLGFNPRTELHDGLSQTRDWLQKMGSL